MAEQAQWVKDAIERLMEPPEPEPVVEAPPAEVWRGRFQTWVGAMAKFIRENSKGGTCFEGWPTRRFANGEYVPGLFENGNIGYEGLNTDHPRAYVSLPIYKSDEHVRITTEHIEDRLGADYQAALEIDMEPGSKPVEMAKSVHEIRLRESKAVVESTKDRAKDMEERGETSQAKRYEEMAKNYERRIKREEVALNGRETKKRRRPRRRATRTLTG